MLQIKCPGCATKYEYDETESGQQISCDCGTTLSLTAPPPERKCERCGKLVQEGSDSAICYRCEDRDMKEARERVKQAVITKKHVENVLKKEKERAALADMAAPPSRPSYGFAKFVSGICSVLGAVSAIGAIFGMLVGASGVAETSIEFILGLGMMGAGEIICCTRDIAINSAISRDFLQKISESKA